MKTNAELRDLIERLRKRNMTECNEAADVIEALAAAPGATPSAPAPKPAKKPRRSKKAAA
jgi:ribosomal protein L12E/L44/L45/RPP1/RPP2